MAKLIEPRISDEAVERKPIGRQHQLPPGQCEYCDPVESLAAKARHFNALARAALDMTRTMLVKLALQEQRAELEAELKKRKE